MAVLISTPNGIKANKQLNNLASKLEKKYKKSKNLKFGFDMGFDGAWEFVIHNTKTDKACVLKQNPSNPAVQVGFLYAQSFATQMREDETYEVPNDMLDQFASIVISEVSR